MSYRRPACGRSSSPSAASPGWTPRSEESATSPAFTCSTRQSGEYNRPFLTPALDLIPGYGRLQGIVFRKGDERFEGRTCSRRDRGRDCGCIVRDGEPESGKRHACTDRSAARRRQAARICSAAAHSQRGRCGGRATPRRLGPHARHDRARVRARLHPGAARAVRLRDAEGTRRAQRGQDASAPGSAIPRHARRSRSLG